MTTRAREVEAWLREERDRHEAMAAEAEATGHDVPLKFHGTAADKMGEFASALSALIAECEWLPIETAPKDCGAVLIACGDVVVGEGYYEPERDAWYWANTHWTDATGGDVYPTHWRPLPDPPQPVPLGEETP